MLYKDSFSDNFRNNKVFLKPAIVISSLVLLCFLVYMMLTIVPKQNHYATDNENANSACARFIEEFKRLPPSSAADFDPSEVTTTGDSKYLVNISYPEKGVSYHCELKPFGGVNWRLIRLY